MENVSSGCYKKPAVDTRNNWVTMMFKTEYNYDCFKKQSHIDTCTQAFLYFERFGFEFHDFGFGGNHVHFPVNIPKRYSVQDAEIMLKSHSTKRCLKCIQVSVKDIYVEVSGAGMNTMNQQG